MIRPYRKSIVADETTIHLSSAYESDYLIVQEGLSCTVADITDAKVIDELIETLKAIREGK